MEALMDTAKDSGDRSGRDQASRSNAEKDPDDWVTGEEPMTGAQASYLKTLSEEVGEEFDPGLTKARASKRIDELRRRDPRLTGRNRAQS
jgi:Protein of unknown function (DUF3072)